MRPSPSRSDNPLRPAGHAHRLHHPRPRSQGRRPLLGAVAGRHAAGDDRGPRLRRDPRRCGQRARSGAGGQRRHGHRAGRRCGPVDRIGDARRGIDTTVLMPYVRSARLSSASGIASSGPRAWARTATARRRCVAMGTVDQHSQLQLYLGGPAGQDVHRADPGHGGRGPEDRAAGTGRRQGAGLSREPVAGRSAAGRGRCDGRDAGQERPADAGHPHHHSSTSG